MPLNRKLRYGMVGGGPGASIGSVHRTAAAMDGEIELVAGAFSSDPDTSRQHGEALRLDPARVYGSYAEMADAEAALPRAERIDFVTIVTPNFLHYEVATAFIERGIHVVCDKPMTTTLDEAEALCRQVEDAGVVFCLTHNYTGYPLVKQARALVTGGAIGEVRKVAVAYLQGWLAEPLEADGHKQAAWRTDPTKAGAGALGDIGSHAENLARYVTGLEVERLYADVGTVVDGRAVDDDVSVLARFTGGVRGLLHCSQVAHGEDNNLRLRIYGTDGSVDWKRETPHRLVVRRNDAPPEVYTHGSDALVDIAKYNTRLSADPSEAFANVYRNAGRTIAACIAGEDPHPFDRDFPTVQSGARGVHFIQAALQSGRENVWVDASYTPPAA